MYLIEAGMYIVHCFVTKRHDPVGRLVESGAINFNFSTEYSLLHVSIGETTGCVT